MNKKKNINIDDLDYLSECILDMDDKSIDEQFRKELAYYKNFIKKKLRAKKINKILDS